MQKKGVHLNEGREGDEEGGHGGPGDDVRKGIALAGRRLGAEETYGERAVPGKEREKGTRKKGGEEKDRPKSGLSLGEIHTSERRRTAK